MRISASAACRATGILVLQTLHNTPGDAEGLAAKVQWASAHTERLDLIGVHPRQLYVRVWSAECNYARLMQIYDMARDVNTTLTAHVPTSWPDWFPAEQK